MSRYKFNIGDHVSYQGGEGKITARECMHGLCKYKVNGRLFTEAQLTRR